MNSALFVDWLKEYHAGKENAINAKDMKQWGSRRAIRLMVHDLRLSGYPICSGSEGYYYAIRASEVSQTLGFLTSMQDDLQKIIAGLRATYQQMEDEVI